MAIIRTERPYSFTLINNIPINDQSLDWKDLGLLVFLLSKPDGWQVNAEYLANVRKTGVKGIYSGLKAISNAGYATKTPNPKKGGWDWLIFDTPQQNGTPETGTRLTMPNAENRHTANNTDSGVNNSYNPHSVPNADNRNAENGRQVNTETKQILNITTTPNEISFENLKNSKLNAVQYEVYVWASSHEYWHKATTSAEGFLKAYCSPKGGMRKQFEQRNNVNKQRTGGSNGTHQQPNQRKLSPNERVRQAIREEFGDLANSTSVYEGEYTTP